MKEAIIALLVGYVLVSWLIALCFVIKLLIVKKTNKHVLYRVTPIFRDKNLVASGVQMEAESVEDKGKSICFNVYVYNNQPGVEIDYKTGKSKLTK